MIEAAMFIALGFFTAGLIGLALTPAIYRRAVRLTKEAMNAVNPASYAEVRAAQDHERAQHAIALRRVERELETQRHVAAESRLKAGQLTAEILRLKAGYERDLAEVRRQFQAQQDAEAATEQSSKKSVSRLKQELEQTKLALTTAETTLSEAQRALSERAAAQANPEPDMDLMPTGATMELATITSLESQIAQLKARLEIHETKPQKLESVPIETTARELQTIVSQLESELVNAEANFISAQAEVTRLSVELDSADLGPNEIADRLRQDLAAADKEKARLAAGVERQTRKLARAMAQIARLRQDIAASSDLGALRTELKAMGSRIAERQSGADPDQPAKATAPAAASGTSKPARARTAKAGKRSSKVNQAAQTVRAPEPGDDAGASIAPVSAASALVSRIVRSQRAKPARALDHTPASTDDHSPDSQQSQSSQSKDKNRDVA